METRKTDMFIWGVIIVIISIALMVAFLPQSTTNPYAPYICHGNITDTTNVTAACYNNPQYQEWNAQQSMPFYDQQSMPFYDIIFIIIAAIGICMMVYAILTDLSEDSKEEDIWN